LVEKLKNARVKGTYLYFISLGRLVEIGCRGYPGREIDNLIGFIEGYRADPEKIGDCFASPRPPRLSESDGGQVAMTPMSIF